MSRRNENRQQTLDLFRFYHHDPIPPCCAGGQQAAIQVQVSTTASKGRIASAEKDNAKLTNVSTHQNDPQVVAAKEKKAEETKSGESLKGGTGSVSALSLSHSSMTQTPAVSQFVNVPLSFPSAHPTVSQNFLPGRYRDKGRTEEGEKSNRIDRNFSESGVQSGKEVLRERVVFHSPEKGENFSELRGKSSSSAGLSGREIRFQSEEHALSSSQSDQGRFSAETGSALKSHELNISNGNFLQNPASSRQIESSQLSASLISKNLQNVQFVSQVPFQGKIDPALSASLSFLSGALSLKAVSFSASSLHQLIPPGEELNQSLHKLLGLAGLSAGEVSRLLSQTTTSSLLPAQNYKSHLTLLNSLERKLGDFLKLLGGAYLFQPAGSILPEEETVHLATWFQAQKEKDEKKKVKTEKEFQKDLTVVSSAHLINEDKEDENREAKEWQFLSDWRALSK